LKALLHLRPAFYAQFLVSGVLWWWRNDVSLVQEVATKVVWTHTCKATLQGMSVKDDL